MQPFNNQFGFGIKVQSAFWASRRRRLLLNEQEMIWTNQKLVLMIHMLWPGFPFSFSLCSRPPLSDIFFMDPHDITRYFGIWYDYHTILAIFYDSWSVQNLSKNCAKCVICMSNTHNGTRWMHQMHKSGIKYANSCKRYVLKNAKSQVILILEANWRQFTVHTSL